MLGQRCHAFRNRRSLAFAESRSRPPSAHSGVAGRPKSPMAPGQRRLGRTRPFRWRQQLGGLRVVQAAPDVAPRDLLHIIRRR